MMALAPVSGPLLNHSDAECSKVVFQPQFPFEKCGTEDPRVVQQGGVTYLFYTAYDCSKAALSLATTLDPTDPEGWTRHGPLFPSLKWSKSGAVLIRDSPPHYMFFGDSTLVPGLRCVAWVGSRAVPLPALSHTCHTRACVPLWRRGGAVLGCWGLVSPASQHRTTW